MFLEWSLKHPTGVKTTYPKKSLIEYNVWMTGIEHLENYPHRIKFATEIDESITHFMLLFSEEMLKIFSKYWFKNKTSFCLTMSLWSLILCPVWTEIQIFTIQHLPGHSLLAFLPPPARASHHLISSNCTKMLWPICFWKISNTFRKQIAVYQ